MTESCQHETERQRCWQSRLTVEVFVLSEDGVRFTVHHVLQAQVVRAAAQRTKQGAKVRRDTRLYITPFPLVSSGGVHNYTRTSFEGTVIEARSGGGGWTFLPRTLEPMSNKLILVRELSRRGVSCTQASLVTGGCDHQVQRCYQRC
jgi:hypothetical protein